MLGLLNLLVAGGFAICDSIKQSVDNAERREQTKNERENDRKNGKYYEDWYVAERGQLRRISTNEKIIVDTVAIGNVKNMSNYQIGDRIMYTNNWKFIRNLSAEQRELDFKNAKQNANGRKAVKVTNNGVYEYYENDKTYKQQIKMGQEFRDVQTGEKYYIRAFDINYEYSKHVYGSVSQKVKNGMYVSFYMNLKGQLIGLSDDEKKKEHTEEQMKAIIEFMEKINEGQRNGGWSEWCHSTKSKSTFYKEFFLTHNEGWESDSNDYSKEFMKDL